MARAPLARNLLADWDERRIEDMHRDESDQLLCCADCGAEIDSRERLYGFGSEGVLCFACAERRGGSYDATHDRWTESPDLSGLARPED